jgi:DNA polymerase (family 10)
MKNFDISNIFNKMADLLEIKGENPFRIRAYRKAAFNIESLGKDVTLLSREELMKVPGIGGDLAGKIEEYISTGEVQAYEHLKKEVPESLVTLLSVPGLGPKTVSLLYSRYHVKDIDELERLARGHELIKVPGIREKTEASILKGIEMLRRASSRYPIGKVLPVVNEIMGYLSGHAPVGRLNVAGSIRRWKETIGDIDILSTSKDPGEVMGIFTRMPAIKEVLMKGPTKSSVVLKEGLQVDIRVVDEESYGAALAYFTGSKAHNIRLREIAVKAGLKLNEYGLFREKDNKKIGGRTEEEIYEVLKLQFVPPELREDTGEVEAASEGSLPHLVELADIKGDLHVHSNWSDGNMDLEDLVEVPIKRGYRYVAVTDHSKGLGVARGLHEDRVIEQKKRIDALNKKLRGFRLLAGIEINIKNDGGLDFDEETLRGFDIVVASVHSGFKQSKGQITKRIVTAMQNPFVSVIAHPSGRLIGERDPYEVDMEAVLDAAASTGTAIEINSYPLRLDLTEPYIRPAKLKGVMLAISTDSHNSGQFDNMIFGVSLAKRGWLEKRDVLNTLDLSTLLSRIKRKRRAFKG